MPPPPLPPGRATALSFLSVHVFSRYNSVAGCESDRNGTATATAFTFRHCFAHRIGRCRLAQQNALAVCSACAHADQRQVAFRIRWATRE